MIIKEKNENLYDKNKNILSCVYCNSMQIHKDGKTKYGKQRYYCLSCKRRSVKTNTIYNKDFNQEKNPPNKEMDIEELIKYRVKKFKVKQKRDFYEKLVNININLDGPIGIAHFGDPHVDDDGTDLSEIFAITNLINKTEGMFAGNLGDIQNNWIGRLARLYANQTTTAKESWLLSEHFVKSLEWLYLVGGNHDVWSGDGDPLEFIMRNSETVYSNHGVRINLKFPNKNQVRINARHQFKGNSMWNTAHAISRAIQMGWRDHILTAGHIHVSGYQVLKDPSSGLISHALQVASFKRMDEYANKNGMDDKNIFNCPVTIIDPKYSADDNRLITTIFDPHEGADYLTWKRSQK
ncbi:MAG: hypothetical protein Tp1102DCM295711_45 [Prokaryotic dsDNA virus sp.]|jgi:hypothetical protein|nr:MAG: hypothetical protein Tp1102DCM295711_45 [Prokaryotic dsDNA virus sp.]|tara:strand:+ start:2499 stop:3551 length:1053 start_codon:yes stop_codon:yes gene_type:complete